MFELYGKGVSPGIAAGEARFFKRAAQKAERELVDDPAAEIKWFEEAREEAKAQLEGLYRKTLESAGEKDAEIFSVHQLMLDDEDYCDAVTSMITDESVCAQYAVKCAGDKFAQFFADMDDDYMRERSADVLDISRRVINILTGADASFTLDAPAIIAADDLAPSETVTLDRDKLLAIVTSGGSENSHTAILARTMGIPAIVGVGELTAAVDGRELIVDADSGRVYVDPDDETRRVLEAKRKAQELERELLTQIKGMDNVTRDGRRIDVFANIGSLADVELALKNDAGGIGLFRSEFLYLESSDYPDEETQFKAYKTVLEGMGGRKVVIRTLDIGADKRIGYFGLPDEENPAMGMRAIRICLTRPDVFRTQLRALFRAGVYGKLAVMFPMITSVKEVEDIRELVKEVQQELAREGTPFSLDVELGIMIETPAAAMISDQLARVVDFFSIGTNDLTQYTLAIDRQNNDLDRFYDPHHEGVLRLIELTAKNAHDNGIWVGICGELGADTTLTERFLRAGIDELSVSPAKVLLVRKKVRELDLREG